MIKKVIDTINKYNLIKNGDSIVIGLSGGADSVCLTLVLNELKKEYNLKLKAVHINHKLRGEESDRDMNFCKEFCDRLEIPLKVYEFDVEKLARENKTGVEEFARNLRYKCFNENVTDGKIATAHNLDDVAETMILNITRGASVNGLCSIPAKRDNIIRPLINVSREEIENYLSGISQRFVTDSTNLTDEYTRNKIRHNVIPVLKEINPAFLQSVKRLKNIAEIQSDYFDKKAAKLLKDNVSVERLKNENESVIFAYVSALIKQKLCVSLDFSHIEKCVDVIKNYGKCQLPKGYLFVNEKNNIKIKKNDEFLSNDFEVKFELKTKTPYNSYVSKVISIDEYKNTKNVYNLFLNNAIDYDKICDSLILRNRRAGDKIRLKNQKVTKEIKKIYNEKKIPLDVRNKLCVLDCNGKVIWAEDIGVSGEFCVTKDTKKVLLITREVDYY